MAARVSERVLVGKQVGDRPIDSNTVVSRMQGQDQIIKRIARDEAKECYAMPLWARGLDLSGLTRCRDTKV